LGVDPVLLLLRQSCFLYPYERASLFLLLRAAPAFDGDLRSARNGKPLRRRIARERGAGGQRGASSYLDGRDQLRVGADEGIVFDHGAMLVHTIVITRNGTRTHIDPGANGGVADIRQVIRLGALAQGALLDLNEIAHVRLRANVGTRPQARIGPEPRIGRHLGAVDVGVRVDLSAGTDMGVTQDTMRPDAHAVGQFHAPFEYAAHVNEDIAAADEFAAQVEPRGVGQRHAGLELTARLFLLPGPFELGLLHPAVDAQGFPR